MKRMEKGREKGREKRMANGIRVRGGRGKGMDPESSRGTVSDLC
jgi:hypothetical protein